MKKLLLGLLLTFTFASLYAQNKKEREKLLDDGWDIVIDPIVPKKGLFSSAASYWHIPLTLADSTRNKLATRFKYEVIGKVTDTGGKQTHSKLQQGQLSGSSYTGEPQLNDGNGHGCHVAGIAFADGTGLCDLPIDMGKVKWKPVKVLGNAGQGSFAWITAMLKTERIEDKQYLAQGKFVVYNMSFGGGTGLLADVEAEFKLSKEAGVDFIAAAGNSSGPVNYPGNSPYVIATSAIGQDGKIASFSSFGPEVNNAMWGVNILSTWIDGSTRELSGTSMASPVNFSCAIIARGVWGPAIKDLKKYMAWVSNDILPAGKDDKYGWGNVIVESILQKNPKDMPAIVDPGPINPPKRTREEHKIVFKMPAVEVYFSNTTSMSVKKVKVLKNTQAMSKLVMDEVIVELTTTMWNEDAYDEITNYYRSFFNNRSFQLLPHHDFADALMWAPYFMDMHYAKEKKGKLKVIQSSGSFNGRSASVIEFKPWD